MQEEQKTAAEVKDKIALLKGWGGLLPGKVVFATPPVWKDAYPNEPDKWPVYKFKPADGLDFNQKMDTREMDENGKVKWGAYRTSKIRTGVLDWKNHRAGDMVIPCTRDENGLTDDAIRSLPVQLMDWMLGIIADSESVTPEESDGLKF